VSRIPFSKACMLLAVTTVVSCTNERATAPHLAAPDSARLVNTATQVDLMAIERFRISIDSAGPFTLGQPTAVHVTVKANLPTAEAEIQMVIPELEASRVAVAPGPARVPVHVSWPAALRDRLPLARGQSVSRSVNVMIAKPGYYRVAVSVRKRSARAISRKRNPRPGCGVPRGVALYRFAGRSFHARVRCVPFS
jgi:hypothetical protein